MLSARAFLSGVNLYDRCSEAGESARGSLLTRAQGSVTTGPEQGEPGADFKLLGGAALALGAHWLSFVPSGPAASSSLL
jgi:hypothetical protein